MKETSDKETQRQTLMALLQEKRVNAAAKALAAERGWDWKAEGEQGETDRAQCREEARAAIAGAIEELVDSWQLNSENKDGD